MRSGKLLATSMMALMLSTSGSFAQSSGVGVDVLPRVQIVIEAPRIAILQTVQDLVEQLTADGFTYIEISRTFLGRARIIAYSATEIREIVINPTTGEILRDLAQESIGKLPEQVNAHAKASGWNVNKGGNGNGNGNSGNAGGGARK